MTAIRDDRSLGELFGELSQQTSTLVQKEIELARHEVTRSVTDIARNGAMVGAGAALAYAGLIVLLLGIAWALTLAGIELWLSLLIVGGGVLAIGAFVAYWAIRQIQSAKVVPEKTVQTMQDNLRWAKEQTQ